LVVGGLARKPCRRRKVTTILSLLLLAAAVGLLPSCGGGSNGGGGGVTVAVSPKSLSLFPTQQKQFAATVGGTMNPAVSWTVNGLAGGNSALGTIDMTGLYTAPAAVPSPATVTVAAIAQADTTKSDSASVTITPPTPSGTYPITVTATSGAVTQNLQVTLVVQ